MESLLTKEIKEEARLLKNQYYRDWNLSHTGRNTEFKLWYGLKKIHALINKKIGTQ
jgi:hypothetical protein